ncbi:MAG: glycosyltransferase [Actinomycetota bacterium]
MTDDQPHQDHNGHDDGNGNVLIVSQRARPDGFGRQPAYISFLEAEDTLAEATGADLVTIDASPRDRRIQLRRIAGRQLRRVAHGGVALPPLPTPGPSRPRIELPRQHYDVGVFVGFTNWDLPMLERLPEIRAACDHLVAWMPEVWASDLERRAARYEAFGILDSLVVGMDAGARILADLAPIPVSYVPLAVDTVRFSPTVPDRVRPIDVLGIGRRDPALHEALLAWSHKAGTHYVYDTMSGAVVPDIAAHRRNVGDTYARTSIALTNYAKSDQPEVTRGEREIPGRLWEALAAGALMVGSPPDEDLQQRVIGRTVVIERPEDPAAAVELIAELVAADNRDARIASTQLALRRHDWAHRWRQILRNGGVAVPRGLETRIDNLAAMADSLTGGN